MKGTNTTPYNSDDETQSAENTSLSLAEENQLDLLCEVIKNNKNLTAHVKQNMSAGSLFKKRILIQHDTPHHHHTSFIVRIISDLGKFPHWQQFVESLEGNNTISWLVFEKINLKRPFLPSLVKSIEHTHVKRLIFNDCIFDTDITADICRLIVLNKLRELSISTQDSPIINLETLLATLEKNKTLLTLNLPNLKLDEIEQKLAFNKRRLSPKELTAWDNTLPLIPEDDSRSEHEIFQELQQIIQKNTSIHPDAPIGYSMPHSVLKLWADDRHPERVTLEICFEQPYWHDLMRALQVNNQIISLALLGVELTPRRLDQLADVLVHNPTIKYINLQDCKANDRYRPNHSHRPFAQGLNDFLRRLSLANRHVNFNFEGGFEMSKTAYEQFNALRISKRSSISTTPLRDAHHSSKRVQSNVASTETRKHRKHSVI